MFRIRTMKVVATLAFAFATVFSTTWVASHLDGGRTATAGAAAVVPENLIWD